MKRSLPFRMLLADVRDVPSPGREDLLNPEWVTAGPPAKTAGGVPLNAGNPAEHNSDSLEEIDTLLQRLDEARAAQDAGRCAQLSSRVAAAFSAQGDWLQARQYEQLAISSALSSGVENPTAALGLLHRFAEQLRIAQNADLPATNNQRWEQFEVAVAEQCRCGNVTEAMDQLDLAARFSASQGDIRRCRRYCRIAQRMRVGVALVQGIPSLN